LVKNLDNPQYLEILLGLRGNVWVEISLFG
jgi:hypothetical protein